MDVSQVASNETPNAVGKDPKTWEVAKQFEAMFLNEMFKSMRKTLSSEDAIGESSATKMFTEMLDSEVAKNASGASSTSLAEVLYRQMRGDESLPVVPKVPISAYQQKLTSLFAPQESIDKAVAQASSDYGIDERLIRAVIQQESAGNPYAVSKAGAKGLMQLMDATAADLGVTNSFDVQQNVDAGTRYLKQMLDRFDGKESLALAAYNAGPGAVEKYGGIPPYKETRDYVRSVLLKKNTIPTESDFDGEV